MPVMKKVEQSFFKKFLFLVSLGRWFQMRGLQYEKFTDDGCRTQPDS